MKGFFRPGRFGLIRLRSAVFFLLLATSAGCSESAILNALIPTGGYELHGDLFYGFKPRERLDVYRPNGAPKNAKVVVFFYGGYWQRGAKGDYRFAAEALTSRGYIAVLPDYRLYPGVTFPAFVEDGALAVKWVHDNISRFGGDPNRIYIMGHSAGAHIATLIAFDGRYLGRLGMDRSDIRAVAGLAGPYDFAPYPQDRAIFGLDRDGIVVNQDIEPIHFADGHEPPMCIIQGIDDTLVEPGNAQRLFAHIRKNGGVAEGHLYPGKDHVAVVLAMAWPFRCLAPTLDDVDAFFKKH